MQDYYNMIGVAHALIPYQRFITPLQVFPDHQHRKFAITLLRDAFGLAEKKYMF